MLNIDKKFTEDDYEKVGQDITSLIALSVW